MKRMVLSVIIAAFAVALYGQRNSLDSFFNSYSDRDGYTSVSINGNLFGLLRDMDEDSDIDRADQKITSVRLVSRDKENGLPGPGFLSEIRGIIRHGGYEELMTVKNHDTDLHVMVKGRGDSVSEILVVASGKDDVVIQICGNLTRDDVDRLYENNAEGLARLEMLESSGKW